MMNPGSRVFPEKILFLEIFNGNNGVLKIWNLDKGRIKNKLGLNCAKLRAYLAWLGNVLLV